MLDRVFDDVLHDLEQLLAVDRGAGQVVRDAALDLDAGAAGQRADGSDRVPDHVLDPGGLEGADRRLAVAQELLHQPAQPVQLGAQDVEIPPVLVAPTEPGLHGVERRRDAEQAIADLVRHTGHQRAHCRHCLASSQRRLQAHALMLRPPQGGDVALDDEAGHYQHQQFKDAAGADDPDRAARAGLDRLALAGQDHLLRRPHLLDHHPDAVHQPLAVVGDDEPAGGLEALVAAGPDRLLELRQLVGYDLVELLEMLALGMTRPRLQERAQPVQIGVDAADGRLIGRQIALLSRQEVAALAGLRVLQVQEHVVEMVQRLEGPGQRGRDVDERVEPGVGDDIDCGDDHQHGADAQTELGSDRPEHLAPLSPIPPGPGRPGRAWRTSASKPTARFG